MGGGSAGEGVGDGEVTVGAAMDEVFARQLLEPLLGVDPEPFRSLAQLRVAGATVRSEVAQDPEVELALRLREPGAACRTQLQGGISARASAAATRR